ncbi:MAG: 5-(carboxyamino)imidazole ribonucleotide synthase [Candidatus Mycalebacterium zealandia]|nr:MAG: 5-(carboxyamino)imidazole ribonucleotide synthase [Candidatus Mycalebacterium zealandia]
MNRTGTGGIKTRLGILGGGQLGKMLCLAAGRWNLPTLVLDPSPDCPAAGVCSEFIQGDFRNSEDVLRFGRSADALTIEIEHVNTEALKQLAAEGVQTNPSPEIISLIQDKGIQKQFYRKNGIASPEFALFDSAREIREAVSGGGAEIPFVQKLRTSGYDGRGIFIVRSESDLENLLDGPSVVEELIDVEKELSVIVARSASGETVCFPPVEMMFNSEANLVEFLACPVSDVDPGALNKAEKVAVEIAQALDLRGIIAVEIFLSSGGEILVNESAPRPHNSGHHTIESCVTSQYEQCLRAVLGLPLGDTNLKNPSVMVNLLGEPGHEGDAVYEGLEECMKVNGANFHIYGKKHTKPFRKMGHVTVVDKNLESAFEKARFIKQNLRVVS